MLRRHPGGQSHLVPGQGHAPLLRDAATIARIAAFVRTVAGEDEPDRSACAGVRSIAFGMGAARLTARAPNTTDLARWRCGREAEGGGLLNRYRVVKPYRGFESLRLRQSKP